VFIRFAMVLMHAAAPISGNAAGCVLPPPKRVCFDVTNLRFSFRATEICLANDAVAVRGCILIFAEESEIVTIPMLSVNPLQQNYVSHFHFLHLIRVSLADIATTLRQRYFSPKLRQVSAATAANKDFPR